MAMTRSTIVTCIAALLGGCVVLPLDYAYRDYGDRDYGYRDDGYRDRGYGHKHGWDDRDRGRWHRRHDDHR